jgi:apolipoprotein N-acyltransferase
MPFLLRLAIQLRTLTGWRRWLAAGVAGLVTAAAFAPTNIWVMLFVTVPAIIWLIDGTFGGDPRRGIRAAAAIGWWFGFGQLLIGLYWIHDALLVDATTYGWLVPFAIVLVPAGLALFGAIACAVARMLWRRGPGRILIFAVAWSGAEWLRGHVLTGFPWNLTGYAWSGASSLLQGASVVGIYGLSLTLLGLSGAVAVVGDGGLRQRRVWMPLAAAGLILAALWGGGSERLQQADAPSVPGVVLRIVQPDIDQRMRWDEAALRDILTRLLGLTASAGYDKVTHVIWPETAVPFYLDESPAALRVIGQLAPKNGALITGTIRREAVKGSDNAKPEERYFNSVEVIGHDGRVHGHYDKSRLVPFGEYMPLSSLLASLGLDKVIPGPSDFSAGPGPHALEVHGAAPFEPLICYEAIFPDLVARGAEHAQWMVNVTNDAWFGTSAGPYQHLAQARVRAIEQGLPLIRAANTGISAVIDPYGQIRSRIGIGDVGVIDSALPRAIPQPLYARFGDRLYLVLLLIAAAVGLLPVGRRSYEA